MPLNRITLMAFFKLAHPKFQVLVQKTVLPQNDFAWNNWIESLNLLFSLRIRIIFKDIEVSFLDNQG